jgi:hypothetical protein
VISNNKINLMTNIVTHNYNGYAISQDDDLILIESQFARTKRMTGMTDSLAISNLNKAKALTMALYQGMGVATTEQMAEYYEVPVKTVQSCVFDNKDEFALDGLRVVKGEDLNALKNIAISLKEIPESTTILTIWTPRAALRLGMLLRDSAIAKAVRTVLLDIVESAPQPRADHTIDARKIDLQISIKKLEIEIAKLELQREDITQPRVYAPLPCPPAIPVQTELPINIEQRYNKSKTDLLAAKTLENEAKAAKLTQKFAIKQKQDLARQVDTSSIAAWVSDCVTLNPTAITYVGKATGNPQTHLYPNYAYYCNQHHLELLNMQVFSRALMSLVEMTLNTRLGKNRDRYGNHLIGIAIAD